MSVSSANISTSGLVFCYDTDNIKGYVGPEMRNNATSITAYAHGSGTGYSFLTGTETSYIPNLDATITNNYSDIQNTGASWCCPNPFTFGTGLPISGSTLYTYAIVYKCNSGYTSGNYMYRYEYNGGTYVTEAGVFSDSNRVDLGNGWYWAWGTFTTQATTNLLTLYAFYYQYRNVYDRLSIAYALLTKGDYSKLHPRFWPAVSTYRGVTQTMIDLAGSNTFDFTNAAYNSSGVPTFNGSSNYIISPENSALNTSTPTVEVWIKTNATTQNGFFFEKGQVNTQYSLFQEGANIVWRQSLSGGLTSLTATTATYISISNWAHIVGTYTSGNRRLYINGALVNSDAVTGTVTTNTNGSSIGVYGGYNGARGYYYNGSIGMVKVYDRVLSASEVFQNYNAVKSRYGL